MVDRLSLIWNRAPRATTLLGLLLVIALIVSACGSGDEDGSAADEAQVEVQAERDEAGQGEATTEASGDAGQSRGAENRAEGRQRTPQRGEGSPRAKRKQQGRSEPPRSEAADPETREAVHVTESFYEILEGDSADLNSTEVDTASFCDLMSSDAIRQTIEYVRVASGIAREWDCESAVELLVVRSKRSRGGKEAPSPRIVGVNIEGDRATASIQFGAGPISSVPLLREDGEWKLGQRLGG